MTLERLVEEVRRRSEEELGRERARFETAADRLRAERERLLEEIAGASERAIASEVARVHAESLARAKAEGRRLVFEARQRATGRVLSDVRARLADLAASDDYPRLLKRMHAHAVSRLGKSVRISGRAADAPLLRSIAGRNASADPLPILGGLIAATPDGSRRLDLSFDELLRRREDRVLELARATDPRE